jgi:hypothetical protein
MHDGFDVTSSDSARAPISGRLVNPWLAMGTRPREVVRQMLWTDRMGGLAVLPAVLSGVNMALSRALVGAVGERLELSALLLLCVVVGGLAGLVGLYAGSALVHWTGGRLGGQGTTDEVRNAWGWGNAPHAWGLALYAPAVLLVRRDLFRGVGRAVAEGGLTGVAVVGIAAAQAVLAVWSFAVFVVALSEALRLPGWKALASLALAWLLVVAAIVPLYGLLVL